MATTKKNYRIAYLIKDMLKKFCKSATLHIRVVKSKSSKM